MAQKEERILKDWQDYIEDYERKLNSQSFDLSTANGRRDYAMMSAHLQSLQSKYAYLQQYYADNGELPENITFEAMEGGAGAYRTEQSGEIKPITFMGGGNGGLTVSAPDFSGKYHWSGPESLIASGYEDTSNSPYKYGIEITGPAGAGYISMEVTGTMFVGMTSTYHFHYESLPSRWTVQLNLNNTIPVYDWTSSQYGMNGFTFNGGVAWSLDEMTVPTDEPWNYYEEEIKPNVDPSNDIYPNGYEPPSPGDDPEDGPVEEDPPDKTDWGAPELPYTGGFDTSNSFCNYAAFTKIGINSLRIKLWDQPDDFWDALSMVKSNAANWLDYFVNIRAYPYRIDMDDTLNRYLYIGRGGEIDMGGQGSEQFQYKVPTLVRVVSWTWEKDTIKKHYNNFLDFSPYTKAEIYLPFSGTWEINPTWLYHTELVLSLAIDITDGSGTWQLMAYRDTESAIVLRKQCKVGIELPISGNDAMSQSSAIVNATLTTAQHTVDNVKTIANGVSSIASKKTKENTIKKVGSLLESAPNMVIQGLSDSANMAFASKEKPSYSGGSTGAAAARLNIVPSIKVHRPIAKNPDTFGHTIGNLVNKASKLEKLTGFTTCRNVDMSNVPQATDKEKAELKRILEDGFYA